MTTLASNAGAEGEIAMPVAPPGLEMDEKAIYELALSTLNTKERPRNPEEMAVFKASVPRLDDLCVQFLAETINRKGSKLDVMAMKEYDRIVFM